MKIDMWEFLADYIDDNDLEDGTKITLNLHNRDICKVKVEREDEALDFKLFKVN